MVAGPGPKPKFDTPTLWRAALLQLVAVAVLSTVLALPLVPTLIGAVLAGLPSLLAVLLDAHWAGAVLAVGLFAMWCARLPRSGALAA